MATDGIFTKTSPNYGTEGVPVAFDEIKENWTWLESMEYINGLLIYTGYSSALTYSSGDLTAITIKNGAMATVASVALTYGSGNLTIVAITVNSKTWTYTLTYSSGDLTNVVLVIT